MSACSTVQLIDGVWGAGVCMYINRGMCQERDLVFRLYRVVCTYRKIRVDVLYSHTTLFVVGVGGSRVSLHTARGHSDAAPPDDTVLQYYTWYRERQGTGAHY